MISYFAFYKVIFMVQLLIAEALFTFRLRRRSLFWLRWCLSAALCMACAALFPWEPQGPVSLSLIFLLLFALTLACGFFCFKVSALSLLFCMAIAYAVQHFGYCVSNCMLLLSGLNANVYGIYTEEVLSQHFLPVNEAFGFIFSFVIYYLSYYLFYLFFARRIRKKEDLRLRSLSLFVVSGFAILLSVVVNAAVVYGTTDGDLIVLFNAYNAACCLFIVYALFSILRRNRMEAELNFMHETLRRAREQYEASKRSMELVNIKCHDLKQQIRTIGRANFINETAIAEMSDAISLYDAAVDTGYGPLNIILSEKSLACRSEGISLDCMADGTLLRFMNEAEIYSLFGNAIDNAASAVRRLQDEQKRTVGVQVGQVKGFITVHVYNYFEGQLEVSADGLPRTTKKDAENHGYGLKSIRYIVEKYGGRMSVKAQNNVFNLNIIFPLPREGEN